MSRSVRLDRSFDGRDGGPHPRARHDLLFPRREVRRSPIRVAKDWNCSVRFRCYFAPGTGDLVLRSTVINLRKDRVRDRMRSKCHAVTSTTAYLLPGHRPITLRQGERKRDLKRLREQANEFLLLLVRNPLQTLKDRLSGRSAFDRVSPFQYDSYAGNLEGEPVTIRVVDHPGNAIKPVPKLSGREIRDQKNRNRAVICYENWRGDGREVGVSIVYRKNQRVLFNRHSFVELI